MIKAISKILGIILFILWIGSIICGAWLWYQVDKDTISWLERAQVSSNPTDMRVYLENVLKGMKKYDITSGYDAIIFKTPENNMELIVKALNRSIDRCRQIEKMNISSVEYQTALDDLRGQLRELDIHTVGAYFIQNQILLALYAWLGWILWVLFLIIALI